MLLLLHDHEITKLKRNMEDYKSSDGNTKGCKSNDKGKNGYQMEKNGDARLLSDQWFWVCIESLLFIFKDFVDPM